MNTPAEQGEKNGTKIYFKPNKTRMNVNQYSNPIFCVSLFGNEKQILFIRFGIR